MGAVIMHLRYRVRYRCAAVAPVAGNAERM